jgi:hypothetical protein
VQRDRDRSDDADRHERLHEGCGEAEHQALEERALARDEISRDDRLAVPWAGCVEDAIGETDGHQGPKRRAALLQRRDCSLQVTEEAALEGEDVAAKGAGGGHRLAHPSAEGVADRSDRGRRRNQPDENRDDAGDKRHGDERHADARPRPCTLGARDAGERLARHGQATIARLAKPAP